MFASVLLVRSRAKAGLPDPRPLIAPLRSLDSAQTSVSRLPDRRLLITIRHAPLRRVTPDMLNEPHRQVDRREPAEPPPALRCRFGGPVERVAARPVIRRRRAHEAGSTPNRRRSLLRHAVAA